MNSTFIKMKLLYAIGILFVCTGITYAQSLEQKVDQMVNPFVDTRDFSGAILIAKADRVVFSKAYGMAEVSLQIPTEPSHIFGIGSISKQFTAVAILRLQEKGIIDVGDTVCSYLPNFDQCNKVSIHHLLTHTSGLSTNLFDDPIELMQRRSLTEIGEIVSKSALAFTPGERVLYSNVGYTILALIIEIQTKMSYEDYLQNEIFIPLKLDQTFSNDNRTIFKKMAQGYDPANGSELLVEKNFVDYSNVKGAGSLFSTVSDLHVWNVALHSGRVLSEATYSSLVKNYGFGRGYGVGLYSRAGKKVVGHDGVFHGYNAFLEWYPEEKVTLVYAGNIRSGFMGVLQNKLPHLYFNDNLGTSFSYKVNPDFEPKDMDKYLGDYELFPGFNLSIDKVNGVLGLRGSGGYYTDLSLVSEGHFYYRSMFADIIFKKSEEGEEVLIWRDRNGNEYPAKRIRRYPKVRIDG